MIIHKKEIFPVREEPVEVFSDVRVCSIFQKELFDPELDETNMERAFSEYRENIT
jgi:hypothetical protein